MYPATIWHKLYVVSVNNGFRFLLSSLGRDFIMKLQQQVDLILGTLI